MATVVKSFAVQGIDGYSVDIETKMLEGQPMISLIGMNRGIVMSSYSKTFLKRVVKILEVNCFVSHIQNHWRMGYLSFVPSRNQILQEYCISLL